MSDTKHTPGKWVCEGVLGDIEVFVRTSSNDLIPIGKTYQTGRPGPNGTPTEKQAWANGRLFSAAPDLLKALIECEAMMRGAKYLLLKHVPDVRLDVYNAVEKQARAAIAKATSEQVPA